jgi:acyl carrier protein
MITMTVEDRIIEIVKDILGHNEVTLDTDLNVASLYHYHRVISAIGDEYDVDIQKLFVIRQIVDFIYLHAK